MKTPSSVDGSPGNSIPPGPGRRHYVAVVGIHLASISVAMRAPMGPRTARRLACPSRCNIASMLGHALSTL
eukprot:5666114-Pyramimonas_sp.AAC.1